MRSANWDESRGRYAKAPQEVPAKGWKDTLYRVKNEISADRLSMVSAAMAYYALFAFIPAISSVVLIYAWISDPADIAKQIDSFARFIPGEVQEILRTQLTGLASKASSTLGFSAISALLIATWSASRGTSAVIDALNIIYDEEDKRSFIKRTLMSIGLALLGAVIGVLAISVVVAMPPIFEHFNFGKTTETVTGVLSWLVMLGVFSFYLATIYRYGPHREKAKWKWVSWGAVIASVLWAVGSALFSWYVTNFGSYNKTYGSMGAIIVLMLWFYISSFVILLGAEVNAELEHQTVEDTTKNPEKPLGSRGATMADTVGETAEEAKSSGARTSNAPDRHQSLWH